MRKKNTNELQKRECWGGCAVWLGKKWIDGDCLDICWEKSIMTR